MNGIELQQYQRRLGHRYEWSFHDESRGKRLVVTDGYEFMAAGREQGWRDLASWGNPGWDLGAWPFVVFMVNGPKVGQENDGEPGPWQVVVHVEGDLTFYEFPSNAVRREGLTYLFVWYAVHSAFSNEWAAGWDPEDDTTWPEEVKGPYGWMRAVAS